MEQLRIGQAPRVVIALLIALSAAFTVLGTAWAATADTSVTDREYVKANGAPPDATTTSCSTNNRQQNEPSAAVDPKDPRIIVAGSNDYCTAETTSRRTASSRTPWSSSSQPTAANTLPNRP